MAHRALTLKYRPQVFADLVGQEHVTRVLTAGLASGRVAQAFLFTGARGVGKTTSARILAKALNCANRGPESVEPCGRCASCVEIAAGVSLDVLEIDGASNRGIADVQQLRENVRFAPTGGRHRVVIIDEVHQLSSDAFAALLKTLEEPPAHLVFIFATTDPQKLPDTIRSRTQRYDFARVPIRRVADRLLEIQKREAADPDGVKFTLGDGAALLIAHKGEGSLRDAVSALDQVVSSGEPTIDEALVRRVLGIADREAFFLIAGAVLARDPQATLRELHAAFDKGADARELAEGLAEHFRNVLVLKVDAERGHELVAASNEDLTRLKQQGEGWSDTDLLRLMRIAAECQWPMRDSPQPLVHLEAAVLQMATLEPAESVAALLERLESLEQRLNGGATGGTPPARAPGAGSGSRTHGFAAPAPAVTGAPRATAPAPMSAPQPSAAPPSTGPSFTPPRATVAAPTPPAAPTASAPAAFERPAASATATLDTETQLDGGIEASWQQAVSAVNGQKRMLGAFLEESRLVGVAGDTLLLAMDDLHRSVIDTAEHRPIVQQALAQAFGRPIELRCTTGTPVAVEKRAASTEASLKPMIDRAIEMFDGEIIDRASRGGERST
jgi:DNA polymerase-3 subunit gamma/tau